MVTHARRSIRWLAGMCLRLGLVGRTTGVRAGGREPYQALPVVLALSLIVAGCEQAGTVSPAASSTGRAPTPAATVQVQDEPTTQPSTVPVANGRIAFRRFLDADKTSGSIFTISPDGTGLQQVTTAPASAVSTEPSWSPDGQWIVYMVAPGGDLEQGRLAKIRPDGTDATDLSGTCAGACLGDGFPAYGPSGQLIAYQRSLGPGPGQNNLTAIFVIDVDGTHARQITQHGASSKRQNRFEDLAPTFAPSGGQIAFERRDTTTGHHAIFTVGLDGAGELQITPWALDASQPDFSPDGQWILFRSNETSAIEGNIWLVHADGTNAHAVTDAAAGDAKWLSGSFSPDGLYITNGRASILGRQQKDADVHVMRLDGSEPRALIHDPDFWDSAPDWGPAS